LFLSNKEESVTAELYQANDNESVVGRILFPLLGYPISDVDVYKWFSNPSNEPINLFILSNCLVDSIAVTAVTLEPSNCKLSPDSFIITYPSWPVPSAKTNPNSI